MAREIKEIEFTNIGDYNTWIGNQYNFNDAFRMIKLDIKDDGTVNAQYIELY